MKYWHQASLLGKLWNVEGDNRYFPFVPNVWKYHFTTPIGQITAGIDRCQSKSWNNWSDIFQIFGANGKPKYIASFLENQKGEINGFDVSMHCQKSAETSNEVTTFSVLLYLLRYDVYFKFKTNFAKTKP